MFRFGVALRMRYDLASTHADDFQFAVDAWGRAFDVDSNYYICRRHIQQYGPRLDKPYPFYDWIRRAPDEIPCRNDEPLRLSTETVGAEIARPSRGIRQLAKTPAPPVPLGRIHQDVKRFVDATVNVVPGTIARGEAVRIHLQLRPGAQRSLEQRIGSRENMD